MLKKAQKASQKVSSKAAFKEAKSSISRYSTFILTRSMYEFDDIPFFGDKAHQLENFERFFEWIHSVTAEALFDLVEGIELRIQENGCGKAPQEKMLAWFEEKVGFKLHCNTLIIADAYEKEKANGGDEFNGLDTLVHLLQCPLREAAGKMEGSFTGAYHRRSDVLFKSMDFVLLILGADEDGASLNLPKAWVLLDVSWFCRSINEAKKRKSAFDEHIICNPPESKSKNSKIPAPIPDDKKKILTIIQLLLLKSAGCNVSMVRAAGQVAKNALELNTELVDRNTPLNFWSSGSEKVKSSVMPDCRFVVTSHISSLLRAYPKVSSRIMLIFLGQVCLLGKRPHPYRFGNKVWSEKAGRSCRGLPHHRFTFQAVR